MRRQAQVRPVAEIARLYGIIFFVLTRESHHSRPHVHVWYSGDEASISIADGVVLAGSLPRPILALALQWLTKNREGALQAWTDIKAGRTPKKVRGGI